MKSTVIVNNILYFPEIEHTIKVVDVYYHDE